MSDTTTPTIGEQLLASTDPDFWVQMWFTHRLPQDISQPDMARHWFANALEAGRRAGQQTPGGHDQVEVQTAIVGAFVAAYEAALAGPLSDTESKSDDELRAAWVEAATPAMKDLMSFMTGLPLKDDRPPVFDQDADQ